MKMSFKVKKSGITARSQKIYLPSGTIQLLMVVKHSEEGTLLGKKKC